MPAPATPSPSSPSFTPGQPGRIVEIDIAKGMACLLMIAAHFVSAKLLPFGIFAAPLFFACSGMNTILLIAKTRGNRRYDLFHVFFPLLLFFGGSTQIVIAQGGRLRIEPEFLQCIALAVLALFLLGRAFRDPLAVGHLFPLPFLVQQLLPLSFLRSSQGTPLAFLFGKGFVLFPWLGFFLFGVFILRLKRGLLLPLTLLLGAAAALALGALRWLGGLKPRGAPPMVDLAVGILFAFLYVLLRRRFAFCRGRGKAAGG